MKSLLLEKNGLPPFSKIQVSDIKPAINFLLKYRDNKITKILANTKHHSWSSLQEQLDDLNDQFDQAWSPVSHMNSVVNSKDLRETYNDLLPIIDEYSLKITQNKSLYKAYQDIKKSEQYDLLDRGQKKVIDDNLCEFRLSGIGLSEEKKQKFIAIVKKLSKLSSQFNDNVLDATMAWSKLIGNVQVLSGMPDSDIMRAKRLAKSKQKTGWMLNLDFSCYYSVLQHCDNQELRKEIYIAYNTRASDQGPQANQFDNTKIIDEILALRHEMANILDFNNYAEYSLYRKMAKTPNEVIEFLTSLVDRCKPQAEKEFQELTNFAKNIDGIAELNVWDIAYYSEKLKKKIYSITQEELKPWFPIHKVLNGLFDITNRLFGIVIEEVKDIDVWHPSVRFFHIKRNKRIIGKFYLDVFARENKQNGAWMDVCKTRRKLKNYIQIPIVYLTCNFSPKTENKPALLNHDEVVTLFHEFGHGIHHMLTTVDYYEVSGVNGVAWDFIELPSQLYENWCWQEQSIEMISGHYETNEALPKDMLNKLLLTRNFQSSMFLLRQLEFGLFDFILHKDYSNAISVNQVLYKINQEVAVIRKPNFIRFKNSFRHVFSGGYAAGYYSYLWADVLSADSFSKFEDAGILNSATGKYYLDTILSKGGSIDPMELLVKFLGRQPNIDAFLKQNAISL